MSSENEGKTRVMPKGKEFSSEYQPEHNGRRKLLKNVLKEFGREVSPETEVRIYEVMLEALSCRSTRDAQAKLKEAEESEPEYGWVFEQTILAIKKDGLGAIMAVLERVYGKKTNLSISGSMGVEMKPLVDLTKRKKNGDNDGAEKD